MVNPFGIGRRGRDPSDRLRGWRTLAEAVGKVRSDFEKQTGKTVFLIADERDRASELAFYLPDRRVEGPGHPPVYIPESQDMVNQFSFWPRYDEFVPLPANAARDPERSLHRGTGRKSLRRPDRALLQQLERNSHCRAIFAAAFGRTELYRYDRSAGPVGPLAARSSGVCLLRLPHDAAMRDEVSPRRSPSWCRSSTRRRTCRFCRRSWPLRSPVFDHEIIFVDDGSTDRRWLA